MVLARVLLPQPDSPTMPSVRPRCTVTLTSSTALHIAALLQAKQSPHRLERHGVVGLDFACASRTTGGASARRWRRLAVCAASSGCAYHSIADEQRTRWPGAISEQLADDRLAGVLAVLAARREDAAGGNLVGRGTRPGIGDEDAGAFRRIHVGQAAHQSLGVRMRRLRVDVASWSRTRPPRPRTSRQPYQTRARRRRGCG